MRGHDLLARVAFNKTLGLADAWSIVVDSQIKVGSLIHAHRPDHGVVGADPILHGIVVLLAGTKTQITFQRGIKGAQGVRRNVACEQTG